MIVLDESVTSNQPLQYTLGKRRNLAKFSPRYRQDACATMGGHGIESKVA